MSGARVVPGPPRKCPRCARLVSWGSLNPRPHRCNHGLPCDPDGQCVECLAGNCALPPLTKCARKGCGHELRAHDENGACRCYGCYLFVPPKAVAS